VLLTSIFAALALLSLVLTIWQWLAAARFPLHQRVPATLFTPTVSLLKPLKGCDAETTKCLRSWFRQDYPAPVQILFGVASPEDPVCEVVRSLLAEHPKADAQLIICAESLGPNPKVSTLIQLERRVKNEVIIVSDADVLVPLDFVSQVVVPLEAEKVGLVNCFYRLQGATNLAMRWESFAVNADFWSQVLQAQTLKPLDFAMGAVMVTHRKQLEAIGGSSALVDYLADDYQLGNRIARSGARIAICPVVVDCLSAAMTFREVWAHQTRWARTIRVCQPVPYFFSILSNATLWPLALFIAAPARFVWPAVAVCVAIRMAMGAWCEKKLARQVDGISFWMGPVKDLLQVFIWARAFLGSHITWRGKRFKVLRGGKLVSTSKG
jgi:ceramide glucosyltransferase